MERGLLSGFDRRPGAVALSGPQSNAWVERKRRSLALAGPER
jgi:hypothetical protein